MIEHNIRVQCASECERYTWEQRILVILCQKPEYSTASTLPLCRWILFVFNCWKPCVASEMATGLWYHGKLHASFLLVKFTILGYVRSPQTSAYHSPVCTRYTFCLLYHADSLLIRMTLNIYNSICNQGSHAFRASCPAKHRSFWGQNKVLTQLHLWRKLIKRKRI